MAPFIIHRRIGAICCVFYQIVMDLISLLRKIAKRFFGVYGKSQKIIRVRIGVLGYK